jgi:hypothetical protein
MTYPGKRWAGFASLVLLVFLCAQPALAAMKIASTTIPIPEGDKPTLLAGLEYPGEWTVAITSVQLVRDPEESADPVKPVWKMIGTSTRPMVQKVIIEIHLLDGSGKKVKSVKQYVVVKANAKSQEIPIKMKVKRADWVRVERLRIKTTFTVL